MAVMWRCPECETMNTEDKCIICGCSKPKTINNTNRPNTVQEQLKISNSNQESLKNVQNSNQYRNKNQYKIDNQQDSINSTKAPASNRKKKNKKIPIAIVSSITVIFIVCVTLSFMKNYVDIADKHEEILPNLTTVSTTAFKLDVASVINENTITTAPVREETTTTVVPESVMENVVEDDMVVMPSLMKKDYSTAIKILDTIGLQYKVTYSEKKYVDINKNCVYSQKPATGSLVKRDTIVEIGISTYKLEKNQPTTTEPTTTTSQTTTQTTTTSASPDTLEYIKEWNETEINETLYIKTSCYSRIKAVVGADSVKKYEVGTKINVISATDTGFYKLKDGSFIHSDYVTDQKPETVNKKLPDTETSTETESHALPKTSEENLNLNGDVTVFSSFNSYYINNFPIEGTSWNNYYWSSDNEACVQFVSGMLVTFFEGEATITLTYISDPSIVATAKVRVVS